MEKIPEIENPFIRFITLRYAMGPMQYFVCIAALSFIAYAFAPITPIPVFYLLISWGWICLSSARLLDAGLWRVLALFTAALPLVLLIFAIPTISDRLNISPGNVLALLYFWTVIYFCLSALPGFWRFLIVPIALVQNFLMLISLSFLGGIKGGMIHDALMISGWCIAGFLLVQAVMFILPSRRSMDKADEQPEIDCNKTLER